MDSRRVKNVSSYLSPVADVWKGVDAVQVRMTPTPLGMQPTEYIRQSWHDKPYGKVDSLSVGSVHDGKTLALKISWKGVPMAWISPMHLQWLCRLESHLLWL